MKALSELRRAQALNPLSPAIASAIAPGLIQNLLAMHRDRFKAVPGKMGLPYTPDTAGAQQLTLLSSPEEEHP